MKIVSGVFGALGGLLAAAGLVICLTQRDVTPQLIRAPKEAEECVEGLLDALCAGDYSGAAQFLYGAPSLEVDKIAQGDAARLIWDAFTNSLTCTLMGSCYASAEGIAQDVTVEGINVVQLLRRMEETAPTLLKERVALARNMNEVYNDVHEYRPAFVRSVLLQAAQDCLEQTDINTQRLTLHLLYDDGWWVAADQAVLGALTGGILGRSAVQ